MLWYKKNIDLVSDYKATFSDDKTNVASEEKSKQEKAYEQAADIRKFEIDKYWSRTGYFWAFIVSIYGAYFAVLTTMCKIESNCQTPSFSHGEIPLLILAGLGLFFSFLWYLANKASRHWQENWEEHMNLLEDEITGPLYKTFLADKSYSVSGINILASKVISFCAYFLLQFEFMSFVKAKIFDNNTENRTALSLSLTIVFSIITLIALYVISINVHGNRSAAGKLSFVQKIYAE